MGYRQWRLENENQMVEEFARSEAGVGGDFLQWLADAERKADGIDDVEKGERRMKEEVGLLIPPATPTYSPPPITRVPKRKFTWPAQPTSVVEAGRRVESRSRERKDPTTTLGGGELGSYFIPSLPRRPTQRRPSIRYPSAGEANRHVGDPHGTPAMLASTSVARLSSFSPAPDLDPR